MAKVETMLIAAVGPLILDAQAIGEKENRTLNAGDEYAVPVAYGLHLIADRFAIEAEPETPAKKEHKAKAQKDAEARAAKEAARRQAEHEAAVVAAEQAVADAEHLLADATDLNAKAAAQELLDAANAALASLEA